MQRLFSTACVLEIQRQMKQTGVDSYKNAGTCFCPFSRGAFGAETRRSLSLPVSARFCPFRLLPVSALFRPNRAP
eukprot:8232469-Lingulodinium_polyedra.AAC.1